MQAELGRLVARRDVFLEFVQQRHASGVGGARDARGVARQEAGLPRQLADGSEDDADRPVLRIARKQTCDFGRCAPGRGLNLPAADEPRHLAILAMHPATDAAAALDRDGEPKPLFAREPLRVVQKLRELRMRADDREEVRLGLDGGVGRVHRPVSYGVWRPRARLAVCR